MHCLETCYVVLAYLTFAGVALELSHRLYWRLSSHVMGLDLPAGRLVLIVAPITCIPLLSACVVTGLFCILVSRQPITALWLGIGLHFAWNIGAGSILGLPYSGKPFKQGVVECDVRGPIWLTGGLHSLDAGVLGTLALVIAALGILAVIPLH